MSNLLPRQNKEDLKKDYRTRLIIVYLFMFFILVIVFTVLLSPSYFLFVNKSDGTLSQLDQFKEVEEVEETKKYLDEIAETREQIRILKQKSDAESRSMAEKLEIILSNKTEGASIASIISRDSKTFEIRGITDGRQSILDFASNLEENPLVTYIEAPISNLLLDSGSPFIVTIVLE